MRSASALLATQLLATRLLATRLLATRLLATRLLATRGRVGPLFVAMVLGAASDTLATPVPDVAPARLEVSSGAVCSSAEDLQARVRARNERIRFDDRGAGPLIRVKFTRQPTGDMRGELSLIRQGKATRLRQLVARSCADAADGIALILSIALDPAGGEREEELLPEVVHEPPQTQAPTAEQEREASEPKGDESPDAPPPARETTTTTGRTEPLDSKPGSQPSESEPRQAQSFSPGFDVTPSTARPGASDSRTLVVGFLAGEAVFGAAPRWMPGVAAYLMLGVDRPSTWAPVIVLGGLHVWSGEVDEVDGSAAFTLTALSLDACPMRFVTARFEARGCASLLAGGFSVEASRTQNPRGSITRPFTALGGALTVAYEIAPPLEVLGRLAPRVNLVRDEFEFGSRVFHSVGALSLTGTLGLGARWH